VASSESKDGDLARSVEFVDIVGFGLVAFIFVFFPAVSE